MVVECQQERRVASRRISDRTSSRRTAILVCGMHRCGTSALTRVLSFLGAALPIDVYPAGPGNEMGHWEPRDLGPLHDRVLASVGTHWASLVPGNERSLESEIPNQFRSEIRRLILEQYGDEALFVVKDPRLSLLLPLWIDVLGELEINPRIIIASRNPIEVALSLSRRHDTDYKTHSWHIDRSGLLWLRYIVSAERGSRNRQRAFYDYTDILSDWRGTVTRLGAQLGLAWPRWSASVENEIDLFLTAQMRHHHACQQQLELLGPIWKEWIAPVYADLTHARLSQSIDQASFDLVHARFSDIIQYFGRYIAAVEAGQAQVEAQARRHEERESDLRRQVEAQAKRHEERESDLRRQVEAQAKRHEERESDLRRQVEAQAKRHEELESDLKGQIELLSEEIRQSVYERARIEQEIQRMLKEQEAIASEREAATSEREAAETRAEALSRQLLARTVDVKRLTGEVNQLAQRFHEALEQESAHKAGPRVDARKEQ